MGLSFLIVVSLMLSLSWAAIPSVFTPQHFFQTDPNISSNLSHPSLWNILSTLQKNTYVDLTHSFDRSIPHWKGVKPEMRTTLFYYDEGANEREKVHLSASIYPSSFLAVILRNISCLLL